MKTKNGIIGNLCYIKNNNTKRAEEALKTVLRKKSFWFLLSGYISCYNLETGDILFFFPLADFSKITEKTREKFIADTTKAWNKANFEVIEQSKLSEDVYPPISFRSLFFRLKSRVWEKSLTYRMRSS